MLFSFEAKLSRVATNFLVGVSLCAVVGWTLGCGGGGGGTSNPQYTLSVTRLKALNTGLILYIGDYDDAIPVSGTRVDALGPYVKDPTNFHSPAVTLPGYGYAMNADIAGHDLPFFPDLSTTISLFDSTDLARNATDATSTMPSPARYGGHNTIGYLDGHVKDQGPTITIPPSLYMQSQTRMKSLDLAMLIYANDYDDVAPLANQWMDELTPYTKSDIYFRSPAISLKNPTEYGYAMNSGFAGQQTQNISNPATFVSFFDSTILTRNATGPTTTAPVPPRYGTTNTIAYADGHVHP